MSENGAGRSVARAVKSLFGGPILIPAEDLTEPVLETVEPRAESWVHRRFINLARRCDRWAQNGSRTAYPARRQLAFALRKAVRES